MDIVTGQKVWIVLKEHPAKRTEIGEGEVTKVGRKYAYVQGKRSIEYKFDLETRMESTDFGYKAKLYLSEQDYKEELEYHDNLKQIREILGRYVVTSITLDQTRRILSILNEDKATTV